MAVTGLTAEKLKQRVDRHGAVFLAAPTRPRKTGERHPRGFPLSPPPPCAMLGAAVNRLFQIGLLALTPLALLRAEPAEKLLERPDEWFRGADGRLAAAHILTWQSTRGDWPKNGDTTRSPYHGDPSKLKGTFDNKATTTELRFLARAFQATGDTKCRTAFLKGFDHILAAQYASGGWPQHHPPGKQYHRHITFNDGTMVGLLEFLRAAAALDFLDPERRRQARDAFDRGVDCILKCQIVVRCQPTVWCAQHDEVTLAPTTGRSYELPSLSGAESAGILRFLMSIDQPSPRIVQAVEAGVAWFDAAKLQGIRIATVDGDKRVLPAPKAPPLWARFYDLQSGRPLFSDRDGVKKDTLAEIGRERRNGYAWYGNWGLNVATDHAKWRRSR